VIYHLFVLWQKLVQKVDAMGILVQELGLPRLWLPFLYQVQNHDRSPITRKEVVKVSRRRGEEGIDDTD
jgi:hypothetical protein